MSERTRIEFGTLAELVEIRAATGPDRLAVECPGRKGITSSRLREQVRHVHQALAGAGYGKADRIAVVLPAGPEMAVVSLSVASRYACAPLNPSYKESEFKAYFEELGIRAVIVLAGDPSPARIAAKGLKLGIVEMVPHLEDEAGLFTLLPRGPSAGAPAGDWTVGQDDIAFLMHTSGTTSRSKVVPLTHRNVCANVKGTRASLELSERDRCLAIMPMFNVHGLVLCFLSTLGSGGACICPPGFLSDRFFAWVEELKPTWYSAVPTLHQIILVRAKQNAEIVARNPMRFVRSGSSALPEHIRAGLESCFRAPVIQAYGLTESSGPIVTQAVPPVAGKLRSVGLAPAGEVEVMDATGGILPPNSVGEVVISGDRVITAYENVPRESGGSFLGKWFRTGDQGYKDEDGYLFITGRIKEIINRAGEKISPLEVEEVLLRHPAVAEAVCFAVKHPDLGEAVGAALVLQPGKSADREEILSSVARELAETKVPQHLVFVKEIPKGATGKLQRMNLAEQLGLGAGSGQRPAPGEAPVPGSGQGSTDLERYVAQVWSEVLGVPEVPPDVDYFRIGGDSILANRIISRIRKERGIEIKVRHFFETPNLRDFAKRLEPFGASDPGSQALPRRLERSGALPISPEQLRWVKLHQEMPLASNRHMSWGEFEGPLDLAALTRAVATVVQRHELLRVRFTFEPGKEVKQILEPQVEVSIPVVDVRQLSTEGKEAEFNRQVEVELNTPFDLAQCPLWRLKLIRTADRKHLFLVNIHHSIMDLWSKGIFFTEMMSAYGAIVQGREPELPKIEVQYIDYSSWFVSTLSGPGFDSKVRYWKGQLEGSPIKKFADPNAAYPSANADGGVFDWKLERKVMERLKPVCSREQFTVFGLLQSILCMLWSANTGGEAQDLLFMCPTLIGRDRQEFQGFFGATATPVPIRVRLAEARDLRQLTRNIRDTHLSSRENAIPIVTLKEHFGEKAKTRVVFNFNSVPFKSRFEEGGLSFQWKFGSPFKVNRAMEVELLFRFKETEENELVCSAFYRMDLFSREEIEGLFARIEGHLRKVAQDPEAAFAEKVSELIARDAVPAQ